MVGPRTNNIGNEAKLFVHYKDNEEMVETSYDVYYQHQSEQYNIDILAFFCVAIKREVINKVGLLDEVYGIGMFEDDDYCMRVKKAGYSLICADDVLIHHHLGASFNKDPEWKEKLFQKNKAIYESRWGKWKGHTYR
jgi:GT2 family glycosyltransferase